MVLYICASRDESAVMQIACLCLPFLLDEAMGIKLVLRAELVLMSLISIGCIQRLCRCHERMLRVSCEVTDMLVGTASETCEI